MKSRERLRKHIRWHRLEDKRQDESEERRDQRNLYQSQKRNCQVSGRNGKDRTKGADVAFGAFGENLIVEGFDLRNVPVDSEIRIGDAVRLKVTQIGKECHSHCAIYQRMGDCIMPREGIFAEVLTGGMIRVGDCVEVVMPQEDRPSSVAVITLSDKVFAGETADPSGGSETS